PAMARADLVYHPRKKFLILPVDRRHQRTAAARDERRGLALVAIGDNGRRWAEHLDLMDGLRRGRIVELEQSRRHESRPFAVDAVEGGRLGAAADDRRLVR